MANPTNPAPGGAGNPGPAIPGPATATQSAMPAANQQPARRARGARTPPPQARVAYTRHATAGDGDDRIVNPAWYQFLKIMLGFGGVAILFWILFGGIQWGKATTPAPLVTSTSSVAPSPSAVPVPVAVPPTPAPPPQVIVIQVPQAPVPPPTSIRVEIPEPIRVEIARPRPVDCTSFSDARERRRCEIWVERR